MLLVLFFFSSNYFFFDVPNLKGINCTPKLCKKNIGHYACLRAKDYCTPCKLSGLRVK